MTANEERQYLCELIMSASEWRLSEGDERDTLRLEIQDRLRRLNGVNTEDENGYIQSEPVEISPVLTQEDYKALEAAKLNDYLNAHLASPEKVTDARSKWERGKVRVFIDGKHVWKKRSECIKEPRDNSRGGCAWRWKWNGPQEKQEQCDAMWENHEAGNDE